MTNMTFTKGIGSPKFMSPEVLNRQRYSKSADIYSFAITMLEIMIWGEAFSKSQFPHAWNIAFFIVNGKRPTSIDKVENYEMKRLIESCWCQEPKQRLTINDIVALLETQLIKK